jgi:hypothetical protein
VDRCHLVWSATAPCSAGKVLRPSFLRLCHHRWIRPQCACLVCLTVGGASVVQEGLRVLQLCCRIALRLVVHRQRLARAVTSKLTFLKRNQKNDGQMVAASLLYAGAGYRGGILQWIQ